MLNNVVVKISAILIGVFFSNVALLAQTSTSQLNIHDAEVLALKNHPQVLAAQALYLRADQITTQARSAYYPALNGEITGAQANIDSRLGAGVMNDPRLFTHFGSGLSLTQLITDSGRTPNLVSQARMLAKASREDFRSSQYDVVLAVDQAYYEVLLSQQLVRVAGQTVTARETVVEQASQLFHNGLKSEVDLSFAQVNLSDAKLMLIRAQDRQSAAYAVLGEALGTQEATKYQLSDPAAPPKPPDSPDALIAQAFSNRPELASIRFQQEADQKLVYAERDLKRPTVNLMVVGGALPYIKAGNANPNIPDVYEAAAVNVQVPIFNGHLFSARRQAAEYQLKATDQRLRDLQDRIARDVRVSWERVRTSFEAITAADELLKQANLALDLEQGRYKLGLDSIVELTQAQLAQTRAEVESVNAKYDYQGAYAVLQYNLGLLH